MKKAILALVLAAAGTLTASAQFEKGKYYGGASLSGFDASYSKTSDFSLSLNARAGYMFEQDWMALAEVGYDYTNSSCQTFSLGASCRYYIEQNGLFLSLGARYLHQFEDFNDFQLTPEVGYCFFLNQKVTLEPSVYYNMSLSDFANKSRFGVKVGVGVFF